MLKTDSRVIDDLDVKTTQLPALRSFTLFTKLGRIISPALEQAADLFSGKSLATMEVSAIAPALAALFEQLKPDETKDLVHDILENTVVVLDGKLYDLSSDDVINHVFTGRFRAMLSTMAFALEVNYSDFFSSAWGEYK